MKKIAVLMAAILLAGSGVIQAQQEQTTEPDASVAVQSVADDNWVSLQAGFWFGYPASMDILDVYGWKIGLPVSSGQGRKVVGFEFALACCATDVVEGLQAALCGWNMAENLCGAQIAPVNLVKDICGAQIGVVNVSEKRGWQFGIVNHADNAQFQFGLVNINTNGCLPMMLFVNFGEGTFK